MKPLSTTSFGVLVLAMIAAFPANNSHADDWSPFRGSVKEVRVHEGRTSILVEEVPLGQLGKAVFHLTDNTRLVDSKGRKAGPSDLKVGQRISVYYGGKLEESNPPQGAANLIVIESGARTK